MFSQCLSLAVIRCPLLDTHDYHGGTHPLYHYLLTLIKEWIRVTLNIYNPVQWLSSHFDLSYKRHTLIHSLQFCDIKPCQKYQRPGLIRYKSAGKLFWVSWKSGDSPVKLPSPGGWCNCDKVRMSSCGVRAIFISISFLHSDPRAQCVPTFLRGVPSVIVILVKRLGNVLMIRT